MKKLALTLILAGLAAGCSSMDKGMSKSDDMMMQDKTMTSTMDKKEMSTDEQMQMNNMGHDEMKNDSMKMDSMQDDGMKKDSMMMEPM